MSSLAARPMGATSRQPQVVGQADRLGMAVDNNRKLAEELSARLSHVSMVRPSTENARLGGPKEPLAPLADRLDGMASGIESTNELLRGLLDCLEV